MVPNTGDLSVGLEVLDPNGRGALLDKVGNAAFELSLVGAFVVGLAPNKGRALLVVV